MREFHPTPDKFTGVFGGSPCQAFSKANRAPENGLALGLELLGEYVRVVTESGADWFLLENVPGVPDVSIPGYVIQRFNLNAAECGCRQNRLRAFQFGSRDGVPLVIRRRDTPATRERTCMASEGNKTGRRTWADFCELQGLPRTFDLPGLSVSAKYRAVGNGVPVQMARVIAQAIATRHQFQGIALCACDCGRPITGRQTAATPACRKRLERARRAA